MNSKSRLAWVIGSSSGLGRQVAENLASKGYDLLLSARSDRDLENLCNHLHILYGITSHSLPIDLSGIKSTEDAHSLIGRIISHYGIPIHCYVISGVISDSDISIDSDQVLPSLLQVNFVGPALLITELIRHSNKSAVHFAIASSVAAIRPRGRNAAYAASKVSLEQYIYSLRHAFAETAIRFLIIRLGYMDTNMSFGKRLPFSAANTQHLASKIVHMTERKREGLIYLPRYWKFIAIVLQSIPFKIYKKLQF